MQTKFKHPFSKELIALDGGSNGINNLVNEEQEK